MATSPDISIDSIVGLNTVHGDTMYSNYRSAQLMQNVRTRNADIYKRNGCIYWTEEVDNGSKARATSCFHWYPESASAKNREYMVSGANIYRFTRQWTGVATDPPYTYSTMNFPSNMAGWNLHDHSKFVAFGDYAFCFNGVNEGVQLRHDDIDGMYRFGIDKPLNAPVLASAGAGNIDVGSHVYAVRHVRETSAGIARVREYWGPYSDEASIEIAGVASNITLTLDIPTDPQVTHVYIYRSLTGGTNFMYLDRISVADLTTALGIYTDSIADSGLSENIDEDVMPPILGIKSACVVEGRLIIYGTIDDDTICRYSLEGRPQEFPIDNYFHFYSGDGKSNNCAEYNDRLLLFKEKAVGTYAFGQGLLLPVATYTIFGNIAYHSVQQVNDTDNNFITFYDGTDGPCIFDRQGPKSIKRISKDLGNYNFVTTDVVKIVENEVDKNYRKWICVGYKNGYIYWGYTEIGETRNTLTMVYETLSRSWLGKDKGYAAGPMFARRTGYDIDGNGELIACQDDDSVRLIEIDSNVSNDFGGTKIEFRLKTCKLGAKMLGHWFNFMHLYFGANLSAPVMIKLDIESGRHTRDYYISPTGKYVYDGDLPFDTSELSYDEIIGALYDYAIFDGGYTYDSVHWSVFTINIGRYTGNYAEIEIYDNSLFSFNISMIKLQLEDRGLR